MSESALNLLQTVFGYDAFRPPQQEVINHLVDGGDAVVLMPTGGGKSLCYQIPAMLRDGVGIIVSPLIALMHDQVSALQQNGVRAAFLNSSLALDEARQVESQLRRGELDLLYVAPERLVTAGFLQLLEQIEIALFAIDEAHCVSQWGHDFRPEYIQLSILHERFPQVPRIALTATADETTRQDIIARLNLHQAEKYISGFDRPNIRYRISQVQNNAREALLRFIRNEHEGECGIVYCLSRKRVEQIADWLTSKGLTALPYHAGLPGEMRQKHQMRFLQEDGVIIVATIAFGMGIDKPDVRFVAHLNLPKSLEAYYQETGRAGRDGLPADAWMSYGLQDVIITLRQMLESSEADETHKRIERFKLESILGFAELTGCRRQALLAYFGDHLDEPCGNCDTCLSPVETWDATEVAQKALSCVHRTGQRFGVNYLIDVLLGKDMARIRQFGHDRLSVYGIGKELDNSQWRSVFRQLIARNLLTVDIQGHGGLHLSESCREVLRGETRLMLRKERKPEKATRRGRRDHNIAATDSSLWEALRECRSTLARELDVPPYVIFHDATLMEMLERQPTTAEQLLRISGVGERKRDNYGEAFLEVIRRHIEQTETGVTDTTEESLQLFRLGMDVESIARQRDLKPTTVYGHLAQAIEAGKIPLREVVAIDEKELTLIENLLLVLGDNGRRLKPIYEALDGQYDYGVLRCIKAALPQ